MAGLDLSMLHAGAILLDVKTGSMLDLKFIVDHPKTVKRLPDNAIAIKLPKGGRGHDKENRFFKILVEMRRALGILINEWSPSILCIENYAFGASGLVFQIGEVGGAAKIVAHDAGVPMVRLHDPNTVKMFATHNGNADKEMMAERIADRWGLDFSKYNQTPKNETISGDLYDAYALAQLGRLEYLLRAGEIDMKGWHPKEIQAFNRTTNSYPVSLLGREWIKADGDE